jgi:hypothetical protein
LVAVLDVLFKYAICAPTGARLVARVEPSLLTRLATKTWPGLFDRYQQILRLYVLPGLNQ